MKQGDLVKISIESVNGYKKWKKGEIVKVTHLESNYTGDYACVIDEEDNKLTTPIEYLEEIDQSVLRELSFKELLRELEVYKNVFCTGEELPGIRKAIEILNRLEAK